MPDKPQSWRVHIGAHKTASTHLQEILAMKRRELRDAGVDTPGPDRLVRSRLESMTRPGTAHWKHLAPIRAARRWMSVRAIQSRPRLPRVVVSDERLVGWIEGLFAGPFYPDAAERMGALGRMLAKTDLTLFLAVRNQATLLPSAYCQCLRMGLRPILTIEEMERRAAAGTGNWLDLIRRIRAAAPRAGLVVWRFEDYVANPGKFIDLLTGTSPSSGWPVLEAPRSTKGLSWEAVRRMLDLDGKGLGERERERVCREIADADDGKTPFRPFGPETTRTLGELYDKDIEAVRREFPGMLFQP